ncbi:hypothetical protein IWQ62_001685 [Dispira parvispora]|uniref:F-box domain-containing protein n=1 Tax=Dispira parvispora TaxID=1520584 RepID=A0A9W8E4N0_9FUNG|nr:hypothetical protein IWQ62_001685 [Dispira parvispora]
MTLHSSDNTELAEFRRQWQAEVQAKTQAGPSTQAASEEAEPTLYDSGILKQAELSTQHRDALTLYLQAMSYEQEGNLGEALLRYQRAFKLHSHVDNLYRKLCTTKPPKSTATRVETSQQPVETDSLAEDMIRLHLTGTAPVPIHSTATDNYYPLLPENPLKPSYLASLPTELCVVILRHLLVLDQASLGKVAQTCKYLHQLSRDPLLWRWVCELTYSSPALYTPEATASDPSETLRVPSCRTSSTAALAWDFTATESVLNGLDSKTSHSLTQHLVKQVQQDHRSDWRRMYMEKPRVRWDGAYISTCYYVRQGRTENTWYHPVHLVTYYRYFRFYPDGRCVKLLTTDEPKKCVRQLGLNERRKGLMQGHYTIRNNLLHATLTDPTRSHITFYVELRIKSTGRQRHNKLEWLTYSSFDTIRAEDLTEYSLDNFQPFYYSRVRSYTS